jgi:hypothetical protein
MVLASPSLSSVLTRSTSVSSSSASPDVNTPATPASNFPPSPPSLSPYNKKSSSFFHLTSPSSSYEDDAVRPGGGRMVAGRERGNVERAGSRSRDHRQEEGLGLTFPEESDSTRGRPGGEGESVHGTEEEARRLTFQERLTAMQAWSKSRTSVVYLKGGSASLSQLLRPYSSPLSAYNLADSRLPVAYAQLSPPDPHSLDPPRPRPSHPFTTPSHLLSHILSSLSFRCDDDISSRGLPSAIPLGDVDGRSHLPSLGLLADELLAVLPEEKGGEDDGRREARGEGGRWRRRRGG